MNASKRVPIGFSTVMCFTRERFHTRRRRKVLMSEIRPKTRDKERETDLVTAAETAGRSWK